MSNKAEYVFDDDIAEAILDSEDQLVKIVDENGRWTGETLNKAHIINTKFDVDETRQLNKEIPKLPKMSKKEEKEMLDTRKKMLLKYKPKFLKDEKEEIQG